MSKKINFLLLFIATSFLISVSPANAGDFHTDAEVNYFLKTDGTTNVTYLLQVTNARSEVYASSYILKLSNIEPQGVEVKTPQGKDLNFEVRKSNGGADIEVKLPEEKPGVGNFHEFSISYLDSEITKKSGEIWEVSIPRLENGLDFRTYDAIVRVPTVYGNTAYIAPKPVKEEEGTNERRLFFEKREIEKAGISAGFGQFQVFAFNLTYHLENPLSKDSFIEIALPPDTATQKVFFESIVPKPDSVIVDADGNWLGRYNVHARERVDVIAKGVVQLFSRPIQLHSPSAVDKDLYTKPTAYWQSEDPDIAALAQTLRTPEAIYNYVITKLVYKTNQDLRRERLGAKSALNNPTNAICMEFTDLFIALARAAGIPAREINGFAYTENPVTQPLSLVADVLHSWPEYWDSEQKSWIPIDPTWGSITKGVDYFHKLDLRHFAFVIHGKDPEKPYPPGSYKLGPQPQKDVFVTFGQLPLLRKQTLAIFPTEKERLPLLSRTVLVKIENESPFAVYDQQVEVMFNNEIVKSENIKVLPPASNYETIISVPVGFLGTRTPTLIKVKAGENEITIPNNKANTVVLQLAIVGLVLFFAIAFSHSKLLGGFLAALKSNAKHTKSEEKESN